MTQKRSKIGPRTGVAPGTCRGDIAKRRRAEGKGIVRPVGHPHPADVAGVSLEPLGLSGAKLWLAHGVEVVISLELARMTAGTAGLAIEQVHTRLSLGCEGRPAAQHQVEGRVVGPPFEGNESGDRI